MLVRRADGEGIATSNTHVATGPDDIVEQHRPLAQALLPGDADAAAREAWLYNESEGRRLMNWLNRASSDGLPVGEDDRA